MELRELVVHLKKCFGFEIYAITAPKGAKFPYCVYEVIQISPRFNLSGSISQKDFTIELNIFFEDSLKALEFQDKLIKALNSFKRPVTNAQISLQKEGEIYAVIADFEFFI